MSQTQTVERPDVSQVGGLELPISPFPGTRNPAFRIFLAPEIHTRLWQHGAETLAVEICGVLVGTWSKDEHGSFVTVAESIRGEAATSKFAEVTFTHETWAKINHEMDTKFSHQAIVGWYHTHPDFGVFLSDRDVFIHQHFFSGPGQVAYVMDPVRKTEGVFVWKEGKPALAPHYWIGERLQVGGAACLAEEKEGQGSPAPAGAGAPSPEPVRARPSWFRLTPLLAYLALFLLGFLFADRMTDRERVRNEQDAVARASLWLGVKPGLREALDHCLADLGSAGHDADSLAGDQQQQAGDMTEARQQQWNNLRTKLKETQDRLLVLQSQYCLTNAETEQMIQYMAALLAANDGGLTPQQREEVAGQWEKRLRQGVKQGLFELPENPPGKNGEETSPATKKS